MTTQYVLDAASDQLFIQNPPNSGTVTAGLAIMIGNVLLDFTAVNGFDIPSDVRSHGLEHARAVGLGVRRADVAGEQRLYSIDLVTGRRPTSARRRRSCRDWRWGRLRCGAESGKRCP